MSGVMKNGYSQLLERGLFVKVECVGFGRDEVSLGVWN